MLTKYQETTASLLRMRTSTTKKWLIYWVNILSMTNCVEYDTEFVTSTSDGHCTTFCTWLYLTLSSFPQKLGICFLNFFINMHQQSICTSLAAGPICAAVPTGDVPVCYLLFCRSSMGAYLLHANAFIFNSWRNCLISFRAFSNLHF